MHPWRDALNGGHFCGPASLGHLLALGQGYTRSGRDTRSPGPPAHNSFTVVQPGGSALGRWEPKKLNAEGELSGAAEHLQSGSRVSSRRETGERCGRLPYVSQGIPKR